MAKKKAVQKKPAKKNYDLVIGMLRDELALSNYDAEIETSGVPAGCVEITITMNDAQDAPNLLAMLDYDDSYDVKLHLCEESIGDAVEALATYRIAMAHRAARQRQKTAKRSK